MKKETLSSFIVAFVFLVIFGDAALSKFIGGETPSWFLKQFSGSPLDFGVLSLQFAFWSIAVAEALVFALMLLAVVRKELSQTSRPFLNASLTLAQFVFIALMFGLRVTHKYDDAALLFMYTLGTFVFQFILNKQTQA